MSRNAITEKDLVNAGRWMRRPAALQTPSELAFVRKKAEKQESDKG
jgi:hypothetical protein